MHKNPGNQINPRARPLPGGDIGGDGLQRHAAMPGQRGCLGQPDAGPIHRCDLQPLTGQPDAIAPFAIAHGQGPQPRTQAMRLGLQIKVRRFAKFKPAILVAFIPGQACAHDLPREVGRQSGGASSKPAKSKAGLTVQPTSDQRPRETALCHQPFGTRAKGR